MMIRKYRNACELSSTQQETTDLGMKTWLLVVGALIGSAVECHGTRILAFYPFPPKSHHAVFTPIIRELANRGHHVTYVSPHTLEDPPPNMFYEEIIVPNPLLERLDKFDTLAFSQMSGLQQSFLLGEIGLFLQEAVCSMKEFKSLIESDRHYDAVMTESYFVQESYSALAHRFGAVDIETLPLGGVSYASGLSGGPFNPSYMLDYKTVATDRMTFLETVVNTMNVLGTSLMAHLFHLPRTQTLMDSCYVYRGSDKRPPLIDLLANKSLIIFNSHFSLDYAYPSAPHSVDVAGINIKPRKPLPNDLKAYMDGSKDGVIYFSLGSNINISDISGDNVYKAFNSAFKKVKQNVLWKWESGDMPDKPSNVKTSSWFPQQDILAHENCRLFITHGGFLSINEAVNYGVPLMGIPFFGDQPKNMKHVTSVGYGIQLDFDNITEESVLWGINEVLTNPSYRESVKARSKIFRDRPMSALDTAVYWIEYVIRHKGAPHLRPAAADLPWYKWMLLDVGAAIAGVVLTVVCLLYLMLRKLVLMICCRGYAGKPKKSSKVE